jgi:hypothetical protein
MSDTQDDPAVSPFEDTFASRPTSGLDNDEEPFQARRVRANKLAKFFGVSYRDLFNAVCVDDTLQTDEAQPGPSTGPAEPVHATQHPPMSGSEVVTNNGVKWVEPKSVDEVLSRLRAMKSR